MDENQTPEPAWGEDFLRDRSGESFYLHLSIDQMVPVFIELSWAWQQNKHPKTKEALDEIKVQLERQGIDWELYGVMVQGLIDKLTGAQA